MQLKELARRIAFNTENLFPVDCIEILKQVYGLRLERMMPHSIHKIIALMMATHTDCIDHNQIEESVQDYCNS